MIRVLQVVTQMNRGGLETMIMNYYRNIDRNKVQFDFIVHREARAAYDDEIEALGGRIFRLPKLNPLSIEYRKSLDQFFERNSEYKIIHSHINTLSALPLGYAKKHQVPVRISHSHISDNQKLTLKNIVKLYYRRKLPKLTTFQFACGEKAGKWLYGDTTYEVLPNAIDAKRFSFNPDIRDAVRMEFGIAPNTTVLGHVGRFNAQKNHSKLIDIYKEYITINPDSMLLLVGQGEEEKNIRELITSIGLDKQVIFAGVRSDIDRLMQGMDVFVMPSLFEGLPVTMIEAQASGLPCVISDRISRESVLTENVISCDIDVDSYKWAQLIDKIKNIQRENTYSLISKAGYDVENNAKYLQEFYEKQYSTIER